MLLIDEPGDFPKYSKSQIALEPMKTQTPGGRFRMKDAAPTLAMVISYWGYVAFLPALIIAFAVLGLIRRKD